MLLKLDNIVKKFYNGDLVTPALRGVTFAIKEGEFVAIIGSSGSGKSTLMNIVGFLDRPTEGNYFFEGDNTNDFDDDKLAEIRNQKIGFIFQSYNLLPRASVLNNVLLPTLYAPHQDQKELEDRALTILKRIGLDHRVNYSPNQLSGGEQQRVAIARALINQPRIILADEPTGNLDSKSGQEVMEVLQELNRQGNTIVLITHEEEIAECSQRIIELKDGQVEKERDNQPRDARKGLRK
mgnify:CR=1 FL=1